MIALALLLAAAPAAPSLASAPALFQRAEPSLEAGARALAAGDVDGAIEKFRRAQPESDDERAIVEYDVGSALLARAALAAAPAPPAGGGPSTHADPAQPAPDGAPAGPDTAALDDARAAFERAYGIAKDRRLKSEAALASGNAAAFASKLDDAIAEYRKSVVADPTNERAKTNLKRALEAKRAQPPPPPSPDQGGEGDDKEEPKDGDEKEPKDGDEGDEPKDDKGDGKKPEPKDGDKPKDDKGDGKKPEPKDGDKPDDKKPEEGKGAQKKKLKKEEARRLLEMMRSRERPLTPMEMRGEEKPQKPKQGKDW